MAGGGEFEKFKASDIRVRDLVLDDLVGYRDFFEDEDENIVDRHATIVLYEIYGEDSDMPDVMPLPIKRWVAANTVKRLLPALRTYISKRELRSDVQRDGYVTFYDQLNSLEKLSEEIDQRLTRLQPQVQALLAEEEFASGLLMYDRPRATAHGTDFVTYSPQAVGVGFFPKTNK